VGENKESITKSVIKHKIAGEVVMSDSPADILKKWRRFFGIAQSRLAGHLGVSPSVICDYESGRRKSPGVNFVRKIIDSFVQLDSMDGINKLASLDRIMKNNLNPGAIMDIREFSKPIRISDFCDLVGAKVLTKNYNPSRLLYGYTSIDAVRAITELSADELTSAFGKNPERGLIFTNVRSGRSIMVALKTAQLMGEVFRPTLVVMRSSNKVDRIAVKIAEDANIILCSTKCKNIGEKMGKFR